MIRFKFTSIDDSISQVHVTGHAHYAHKGKDIVCAAVSTAILVTVNAMEVFKLNQHVDLTIKEGHFTLKLIDHHDIIEGLLINLKYTLEELEKQYPKYIKNQREG